MPKIILKANNDCISWCECDATIASYPAQIECPWDGGGWLFTCISCRKAFTFGRIASSDRTLKELALADIRGRGLKPPTKELIVDWVRFMKRELDPLPEGQEVAYLDGKIFPVDHAPVRFRGWHSDHALDVLPHRKRCGVNLQQFFGDVDYWRGRQSVS